MSRFLNKWSMAAAFALLFVAGNVSAQGVALNPGVGSEGPITLTPAGDACSGGEVYDDGTAENGYSGNPAVVSNFQAVQQFTPQNNPGTYETVCIALVSLGGPTLDFSIQIYDNDGAGGSPGTLINSQAVSAAGIPGGLPCSWYEYDISGLGLDLDGPVYIGVSYNPMSFPSRFTCADETPATPLATSFLNFNTGDGWETAGSAFPNYRAMQIRAVEGGAEPPEQARFNVTKDFDDNNEASVTVTLSCNTGLPLEQTTTIEEGDGVNFVIGDFEQGALNCTVTEAPVDGYDTYYTTGGVLGAEGHTDGCDWTGLTGGQYTCEIDNELQPSEVEVTKEWIDENPSFNPINVADAEWTCYGPASFGDNHIASGSIDFYGNPSTNSFYVYPDWEDGTECDITEVNLPDGGVEVDASDCQNILLFPGDDASCTIVNTRLYEGIPTLSQYGLAVLALLMLGMGFVGFRRFV